MGNSTSSSSSTKIAPLLISESDGSIQVLRESTLGALNSDGLAHIMNYLDENDLCNFAATCKQLYIQTLNDNYLWKNLYQSKFNDLPPCEINSQNVYSLYKTRAVDPYYALEGSYVGSVKVLLLTQYTELHWTLNLKKTGEFSASLSTTVTDNRGRHQRHFDYGGTFHLKKKSVHMVVSQFDEKSRTAASYKYLLMKGMSFLKPRKYEPVLQVSLLEHFHGNEISLIRRCLVDSSS